MVKITTNPHQIETQKDHRKIKTAFYEEEVQQQAKTIRAHLIGSGILTLATHLRRRGFAVLKELAAQMAQISLRKNPYVFVRRRKIISTNFLEEPEVFELGLFFSGCYWYCSIGGGGDIKRDKYILYDANSYGFRKHRAVADAIAQCYNLLAKL